MELKFEEKKDRSAIPGLGLCKGCVPISSGEQLGVTAVTACDALYSFTAGMPVKTMLRGCGNACRG
jgi:hypothetical protein